MPNKYNIISIHLYQLEQFYEDVYFIHKYFCVPITFNTLTPSKILKITIRILKVPFRNCVSSLLSTHYRTFLFTGPFDLTKAQRL